MNLPLGQLSGSDAVDALHETIKELDKRASEQAAAMIQLTRAICVLSILMLLGLGVQIWIALTLGQ